MGIVKTLHSASAKGMIWVLFMLVFTTKCCDLFIDCLSYSKLYDVTKTSDDNQSSDSEEDAPKKTGKELFSFFEENLNPGTSSGFTHPSEHWSVYSLIIFKEPLRDVLTPPPNSLSANPSV